MQNREKMGNEPSSNAQTSCWTMGFIALLITQFTVAMNDNVFRWLIIPIGKHLMDADTVRTLGGIFLLAPFLIFASLAGYITDKHSRRSVMIWCKFVEMILLLISVPIICFTPDLNETLKAGLLLAILFSLGTQSTFFSPSKYGIIPDIIPENQISNANGILAMLTMIAIVTGQVVGGYLFAWTTIFAPDDSIIGEPGAADWRITFGVLVGVALIGYIASFFIPRLKPTAPSAKCPINIFEQTYTDLKMLFSYRTLFWAAIASSFFWGLGALSQTNIDKYASDYLKVPQEHVTVLAAILSLGIGAGAVLAGWLSRGRVELGIVPIGLLGMGIFALVLGFTPATAADVAAGQGTVTAPGYIYGSLGLMLLGLGAGLYDVPLAAYLQHSSPAEKRGRILAAYNFCSFGFMLMFTCLFFGFAKLLDFTGTASSLWIWILTGIMILVVWFFLLKNLSIECLSVLLRIFFRLVYRIEIRGLENVPKEGGVLMAANHVSFLDALILYVFSPRPVRYFAHRDYIKGRIANHLAAKTRVMKIVPGKKSVIDAIKQAREGLAAGGVIGVFPEGGLTRTGQIKEFEPGYTAFLKGNEHVPIIPVYIGGLFGSIFSYRDRNRSFFSWPRRLPSRVVLEFGKPLPADTPTHVLKHKIDEMAAESIIREKGKNYIPACRLLRAYKRKRFNKNMQFADSTGTELSPKDFFLRTVIARRILRREVLKKGEKNVGILTPPAVGGAIINAALALDGRTTVNLNYTFTSDLINYCIKQADIKHVITSRRVLDRLDVKMAAEVICIEDAVKKMTVWDKIVAALQVYLVPCWMLERIYGLNRLTPDDILTVVYTSGSTGKPKGAMLSHRGIAENINSFVDILKFGERDTLLGILPFFHSFGYTVTIWVPLLLGTKVVYHYTPLEARKIGELSEKYKCTALVATATFLRNYLKRCERKCFENLGLVVVGAEKMPKDIADAWEEKYGVRPVEGYGATELSPVVGVNIAPARKFDDFQPDYREGSIGRPLPRMVTKIVDAGTWEEMPVNTPGMLVIKGANVMKGYFKEPELTAAAIHDGWYITGDVGKIDKDGFIFLTGRESRISKIGGEMVPHILIEETLLDILKKHIPRETSNDKPDEIKLSIPLAVSAVPDEKKGERIIVLYSNLPISPEEMCKEMRDSGCPLIWIPFPQSFYEVESIPALATGKLDIGAMKKMVKELYTDKPA
ncbi:hypothetical protein AGMMS50229_19730 [Campylobacterota bacterium]|nr:hypothetical protein AGMMS50229_19730 [Campylobacterota bacterium]